MLGSYGWQPADVQSWRAPPGANGTLSCPRLQLRVAGHEELEGHTWYSLECRLQGGANFGNTWCPSAPLFWKVRRRLSQLRTQLHDQIKDLLDGGYEARFKNAHFAPAGGLPGTTAKLQRWFTALTSCVNGGHCPPLMVALILRFLEAPKASEVITMPDDSGEPADWPADDELDEDSLEVPPDEVDVDRENRFGPSPMLLSPKKEAPPLPGVERRRRPAMDAAAGDREEDPSPAMPRLFGDG